ncbi:hypothetical protein Tco_0685049 [Tanacetum coccineum]
MTPICEYVTKEILPEDKKRARAVRRKAVRYAMINGTLYKKSFLGPWLRCVRPLQANYVLREIHEGSCSMHAGPRSVVAKIPQQNLTPITSPWPFYKWGIDIAGPFPEGPGKVKFLIVAMTISLNDRAKYRGRRQPSRQSCKEGSYGITLSADLAYQGRSYQTMESSSVIIHSKIGVRNCASRNALASVKHPKPNGLVERSNRS